VDSFIDYFIEFYESTHMGNGGMTLYSIDPEIPTFHFYLQNTFNILRAMKYAVYIKDPLAFFYRIEHDV